MVKKTRTETARERILNKFSGRPVVRHEKADPIPLTIPMTIPTIEQQVYQFTRLGVARRALEGESMGELFERVTELGNARRAYYEEDEWEDHLDDGPDFISPHEEPAINLMERVKRGFKDKPKRGAKKGGGEPTEASKTAQGGSEPPSADVKK